MKQLTPVHYQQPVRRARAPWRHSLTVVLEHKWMALAVLVVIITLGEVWTHRQTPIYRATATLQLDPDAVKVLNFQDLLSSGAQDEEYFNTMVRVLQSRTLCEQVVKALALDKNAEFAAGVGDRDFAGALQYCLNVSPVRGSRLIEIYADHRNPQVAALLADGVARQFIQFNMDRMMTASMEAVRWLSQQAAEVQTRMNASDTALQQYRQKSDLVSLEERQDIVVAKLKDLNSAVTQAQTERLTAETEWHLIKILLDQGLKPAEISTISSRPEIAALQKQANEKEIALAMLAQRYQAQHPTMVAALAELSAITNKYAHACTEAVEQIKSRFASAQAKETSLQQALKEQEQKALELDRKQPDYDSLKRNVETDRQLYNTILMRMKETSVTGKLTANNIRLLDPVQTPTQPYKPNKRRNLIMSVIIGLGSAIGLCFLLHGFDDRIKSYEDLDTLGLPVLSGVPRLRLADSAQSGRLLQSDPHSIYAEAFRGLRASINLNPEAKDAKILLITSTAPGEGKTMVAANLSTAFAMNHQRTLLIDCDLHHPKQHKIFPVASDKGLALFLTNSVPAPEIIQHTDVPNLDVIQVGQVPAEATDMISSTQLGQLIRDMAALYDRVVIDSPPVMAASDPLVLLPHVEGVLFVIGFSKIRRDIVERAMQKLRDCGAPMVGVVMNSIDAGVHGHHSYPYGESYYRKSK